MKKSIIVVENHEGIRRQLVNLIQTASDPRCDGAFASTEPALSQIARECPDAMVMDVQLPLISIVENLGAVRKLAPDLPVVVMTLYKDSVRISQAFKSGARGHLMKSDAPEQLLDVVRDVIGGTDANARPHAGSGWTFSIPGAVSDGR